MATTATLHPDLQRFPPGTTVKAYKRSNFLPASGPVSGAPQGTQDASATVSSTGVVSFTGLTDATDYLLYASVSGQDRYARFSTKDTPSEGVPADSPAFTGTPTAPTAAVATNTTQLATTEFVQTASGLLIPKSLVDAKGDLLVGSADNTVVRKAVGSDGQVLTADAASAGGVKWATPSGGSTMAVGQQRRIDIFGEPTSKTGTWNYAGAVQQWLEFYNGSAAQNDQVTYHVDLAAGTHRFDALLGKGPGDGILTLKIDGSSVGTIDCYQASTYGYLRGSITGIVVAADGDHTVQIIAATKNASASGYQLELQDLVFTRTA